LGRNDAETEPVIQKISKRGEIDDDVPYNFSSGTLEIVWELQLLDGDLSEIYQLYREMINVGNGTDGDKLLRPCLTPNCLFQAW
jgi:hypothetical protein